MHFYSLYEDHSFIYMGLFYCVTTSSLHCMMVHILLLLVIEINIEPPFQGVY